MACGRRGSACYRIRSITFPCLRCKHSLSLSFSRGRSSPRKAPRKKRAGGSMKRFNYRAHPLTVSLFAAGGRKCRVEKSVGDARRSRENVIWTEDRSWRKWDVEEVGKGRLETFSRSCMAVNVPNEIPWPCVYVSTFSFPERRAK